MPKRIIILLFAIAISTFGCKKGDLGDVKDYLVGKWEIHSISSPVTTWSPKKGDSDYQVLEFKKNGRYVLCKKGWNERGRIPLVEDTTQYSDGFSFHVSFSSSDHSNPVFDGRYYANYYYQPEGLLINVGDLGYYYLKAL